MRILALIIIILNFSTASSQSNYIWSENNSEWSYLLQGKKMSGGMIVPATLKRTMILAADSTNISIDNLFYYDSYNFNNIPLSPGANELDYLFFDSYEFKLHDDIIYFKQPLYSIDTVNWLPADDTLVNFNATIGDSWSFHDPFVDLFLIYDNNTSGITTVSDTGSRFINGEKLKWIFVEHVVTDENFTPSSNSYTDTIFERIGPKLNMFPSEYFYGFDSNFDGGTQFACYSDDNFIEYSENQTVCDFYLNTVELNSKDSEFNLYPNPTTGAVTIILDKNNIGADLSIYNMVGEQILSELIVNDKIEKDLSQLPKGIYFILVTNKLGQSDYKKLVLE